MKVNIQTYSNNVSIYNSIKELMNDTQVTVVLENAEGTRWKITKRDNTALSFVDQRVTSIFTRFANLIHYVYLYVFHNTALKNAITKLDSATQPRVVAAEEVLSSARAQLPNMDLAPVTETRRSKTDETPNTKPKKRSSIFGKRPKAKSEQLQTARKPRPLERMASFLKGKKK